MFDGAVVSQRDVHADRDTLEHISDNYLYIALSNSNNGIEFQGGEGGGTRGNGIVISTENVRKIGSKLHCDRTNRMRKVRGF